jgi:hypothetical protein
VQNVKTLIDRPVYEPPVTIEEQMARAATEEPSVNKIHQPSTMEMQSWKRYPGWKGYNQN